MSLLTEQVRRDIVGAAVQELRMRGIDEFSIDGVARRADMSPKVIYQGWHDRRVLLMEATLHAGGLPIRVPDSGGVRTDLMALTQSMAEARSTPEGRAVFSRLLPRGEDIDLSEVRNDFWDIQEHRFADILRRATARGELRLGVDPMEACRMFVTAINYDLLIRDEPLRPDYLTQVIDIFIRGITA
jgi:AcrR family transcriptional regulator